MKQLFQTLISVLCLCTLASCKEEYEPQIKSNEQSVLVVEGILNSGDEPTTVKLSRTTKLNDSAMVQPVTGAALAVESESGSSTALYESAPGTYNGFLTLDPTEKYQLRITTADQKAYASDFVPVRQNPPIDSVNWTRDSSGVAIFVNTHSPGNNTHFYRWEFEEVWEIRSGYVAQGAVDDGIMEPLYPGESLYYCWKNYNSSNLILANTTQLASDVVFEKPLIKIRDGDDRLSERYSVLVRQYALDKQGYDFYQLLKKNTESLGSIFDPQPTEITGNVHALSDTTAPVIGYITATTVNTARLWITRDEVPKWKPWGDCSQAMVLNRHTDDISYYTSGHEWLIYAEDLNGNVYMARSPCVSCRIRGGSTHRPFFW